MDVIWDLIEGFCDIPETIRDAIQDALETILAVTCTPFTFDWVSTLMTTFQGLAIGIVTVIVLLRGVLTGILLEGGSEDESIGHYLFTSLVPVAVIAACPTIVAAAVSFTTGLVGTFMGTGSSSAAAAISDSMMQIMGGEGASTGEAATGGSGSAIINVILLIVTIVYAITIAMQCARRWIQLEVLSVITPLTAVTTAIEDSADFTTVLKSMLFLGVTTLLQVALLSSMGGLLVFARNSMGLNEVGTAFLLCAAFGAIKQVPDWIEKYTYAAGVAPRGGGAGKVAAYAAARGAGKVVATSVRKVVTKGV